MGVAHPDGDLRPHLEAPVELALRNRGAIGGVIGEASGEAIGFT